MDQQIRRRCRDDMTEVKYVCYGCGATQLLYFFPGEKPFPAIGCSDCKQMSAKGLTLEDMIVNRVGMFPEVQPAVV